MTEFSLELRPARPVAPILPPAALLGALALVEVQDAPSCFWIISQQLSTDLWRRRARLLGKKMSVS
eukprot:10315583-Heterocapsa_arctica.AAC.1